MYAGIFLHRLVKIPSIFIHYFKNHKTLSICQHLYSNYALPIHIQAQKNNEFTISHFINYRYFSSEDLIDESYDIDDEKFIFLSFLDSKDKNFHNLICPNVGLHQHSLDPLVSDLCNSSTVEEVFELLKQHSEPLSLNQACQAVFSLSQIKNMQYLKFRRTGAASTLEKEFCNQIISEFEFSRIIKTIQENVLSLGDLASSLMMCLNNLKLELHYELMVLLHIHMLKFVSILNPSSLAQLSFVFRDKGLKGYFTQVKMLSQIKLRTEDCMSLEEFRFISIFYLNTRKLVSKRTAEKYLSTVQRLFEEKYFHEANPNVIIMTLKLLINLYKQSAPIDICRSLLKLLHESVHILTPYQLVAVNNFFLHFWEPRMLMYKIQEQASRLVNENTNIDVKSDLLLCLSTSTTFKMRMHYDLLAEERIADSHYLIDTRSLFKALRFLNISNFKLLHTFWMKALLNAKVKASECYGIVGERENQLFQVYGKYIYFNNNLAGNFRCYKFEEELISILKEELKSPVQFFPSKVARMVGFLIAYSKKSPPSAYLYEHLRRNYLQLKLYDLVLVTKCLQTYNFFQKSTNKEHFHFLTEVTELLSKVLKILLMEADCLPNILSLMAAQTNLLDCIPAPLMDTGIIVQAHLKYLHELNTKNIILMMKNFWLSSINCPEIFEAVAEYVIKNEENIIPLAVFRILNCFYYYGYYPSQSTEFFRICRVILEMDCERMQAHHLLTSCLALSYYQALSSDLIHYIFSIPFLDQLDEEIQHAVSKNYSYMVRSILMRLNRAVCLDYPEEKIPWFHEKYCRDQSELRPSPVTAFHKDVYEVLGAVLGNTNLIFMNRKVAYGYNVDLEFALDFEGKPIPLHERNDNERGKASAKHQREIYKKVAVMLKSEKCYSSNDYSLKGVHQLERRHLEILGFVVIQIAQRSWYSMAVGSRQQKINLLKSLIYKELSNVS